MAYKYKPGDTAFLIESVHFIREVAILKYSGGLYTVRFKNTGGGIRVRENRLYPTEQAAKDSIPKKEKEPNNSWRRNPCE